MSMEDENVIDSEHWLKGRADRLFAEGDHQATTYYRRLLEGTQDPKLQEHIHTRLGLLAHRAEDFAQAAIEFERASEINPHNPDLAQAISRLSLMRGKRWEAFFHAVRAVALSGGDRPELLPTLTHTLLALDEPDLALTVLLGSLEKSPNHPFLLEALGQVYEKLERWIEAIETRDALIDILKHELAHQEKQELLLPTSTFDLERSRRAQETANIKLRQGLHVANDLTIEGDYALAKMQNPPGLHTLIRRLTAQPRSEEHLRMAQSLWAKAVYKQLDVHLHAFTLAASIEWVTRKLLWAPIPDSTLWEVEYSIPVDRVKAAARLVAAALEVEMFPVSGVSRFLPRKRAIELKNLSLALLLEVGVSTLTPSARMLL